MNVYLKRSKCVFIIDSLFLFISILMSALRTIFSFLETLKAFKCFNFSLILWHDHIPYLRVGEREGDE